MLLSGEILWGYIDTLLYVWHSRHASRVPPLNKVMDFRAKASVFYYVKVPLYSCVLEYFYQQEEMWIQTEDMRRKTLANTDPDKIWRCIRDERLPSSLHSHPCHSLFMSRVLYPVPELGACLWNLFWPVEWADNGTVSQFWDWALRHLTDFLLPSPDFAIFAMRSPSPVQLLLCNTGTRKK